MRNISGPVAPPIVDCYMLHGWRQGAAAGHGHDHTGEGGRRVSVLAQHYVIRGWMAAMSMPTNTLVQNQQLSYGMWLHSIKDIVIYNFNIYVVTHFLGNQK